MTARPLLLSLAIAATLAGALALPPPAFAQEAATAASSATDKAARLDALYEQYWEELLELNPLQATFQGDNRYNDRLPDFYSAQFRARSHDFTTRWLQKIESVGSEGLSGQDLLSYQIFVRDAKDSLEAEKYPGWMMPVNQMGSIASYAVMLGSGTGAQPFKTVDDYDDWLARGNRLPVLFDSAIDNMRQGMAAGVVQPRALMEKVVPQLDALIKDEPEQTLLWGPIESMPADFGDADKARLTAAYREMIGERIVPAFRKLRDFIADEYMPATRESV